MAAARMSGAAYRADRLQGKSPASRDQSRARHHPERRRSAHLEIAGEARRCRGDPQLARAGLSIGRSEIRVNSSISRQLVLWLAVPLMLLALCGALVHYFNSIAPGVISSDRRLKDAANAVMARLQVEAGQVTLETAPTGKPLLPAPDSVTYAVRDTQGRLLLGDAQLPAVAIPDAAAQVFALAPVNRRNVRTLTTRFDTRAGVIILTAADIRAASEPAARFGLMSTLLWDFVQLDVTLVL